MTINLMEKFARYMKEDRIENENEGVRATDEWLNARELDGDELERILEMLIRTVTVDLLREGQVHLIGVGLALTTFKFAYELAAEQFGAARPSTEQPPRVHGENAGSGDFLGYSYMGVPYKITGESPADVEHTALQFDAELQKVLARFPQIQHCTSMSESVAALTHALAVAENVQ